MTTRRGTVSDIQIDSRAVNRLMEVRVITPPGYDEDADRNYPVLYFLHPWGLSPRYITDKLNIHLHAWRGAANGSLPPMLIALPAGLKSFYMNAADPPGQDWTPVVASHDEFFRDALNEYGFYGDYLLKEVIPHIETHYRVRTDRAGRAIGGISMGGAAAAVHAFRDPSRFSAVGIHSPALFTGPPENPGPAWIFGLDRESFAARNPADVAQHLIPETQPRIWLDTGSTDVMRDVVEYLHHVLDERRIKHEFAIHPGGHNKAYWEPLMSAYLTFYAREWLNV